VAVHFSIMLHMHRNPQQAAHNRTARHSSESVWHPATRDAVDWQLKRTQQGFMRQLIVR
jgi:hypothetical protein